MSSLLHLIGNIAVWTAFWASVLFCGLYAAMAPWRRSPEGWHLMTFTAVIGTAFGWIAFRQVISAAPAATISIEAPRAAILSGLAACLVWRLLLLVRTQIRQRKR